MCNEHLKTIQQLERKIQSQKHQLKIANETLALKNKDLDALHYVWCSGGCKTGIHRYHEEELTAETVKLAKYHTNRLIEHFNNQEFRKLYKPEDRKNSEIELIKSEYKDVWFYYSMTKPRKLYHKILKFFSDLVEY